MRTLLHTDSVEESAALTAILQQIGLRVEVVRKLTNMMKAWETHPADLLVLTLSHTSVLEEEQLRRMRMRIAVPMIVITDPLREEEHIRLLNTGVDLVAMRPYGIRLLSAQIRSVLQRRSGLPFHTLPTLSQAGVVLDPSKRTVTVGENKPVRLTQLEFRLMYTLITHPGQIMTTENLVEHVWGYSGERSRELVRGLVQRLRAKVEPEPRKPRYILTEPSVGYYLVRKVPDVFPPLQALEDDE